MHNRKKADRPPTDEEVEAQQRKVKAYRQLTGACFQRRAESDVSPESLQLTARVLSVNPDCYSLWNWRRELLYGLYPSELQGVPMHGVNESGPMVPSSVGAAIRDVELRLSADALRKNPKSYSAWRHRVWVLERFEGDLGGELRLTRDFLALDARNFHCMNYRQWLAPRWTGGEGSVAEREVGFSQELLNANPANASAFHYRGTYLKRLHPHPPEDAVRDELRLLESAVFTEPDDSSAWWHMMFVMRWGKHEGSVGQWFETVLEEQVALVRTLLELEEASKWGLVALVELLHLQQELGTAPEDATQQVRDAVQSLLEVDPTHAVRYRGMLRRMEQAGA
mmetsp:Transcript_9046/g.30836  ORF Transcript_9046/g.30836 Transcript_9046/m.30836 type:complete len:338 (+) Transcript_9046:87-1100(+)